MNKFEDSRRRLNKFILKLEQIESQPSLPFLDKKIGSKDEK